MQIVIDIQDYIYCDIQAYKTIFHDKIEEVAKAIQNGTPLPKGHGAIKDVSQIEIPMCKDRTYERWVQVAINAAPTIIEADKAEIEE